MGKDFYRVGTSYRLLPNHPFCECFSASIKSFNGVWTVVWRDFTTMKQDIDFKTEKEATDFCESLERRMREGITVDYWDWENGKDWWEQYRTDKKPVKEPVSFYDSDEWRAVRYRILKRDGAKCRCCGGTRADGKKLHVDHIKPRSKYPELELDIDNLQVLCQDCNMGKGAWDDTNWRKDK